MAAVLNVTPDHLDRHDSFENYAAAKARIFENQTAEDFAVLNADDHTWLQMASKAKAQVYWFSRSGRSSAGHLRAAAGFSGATARVNAKSCRSAKSR